MSAQISLFIQIALSAKMEFPYKSFWDLRDHNPVRLYYTLWTLHTQTKRRISFSNILKHSVLRLDFASMKGTNIEIISVLMKVFRPIGNNFLDFIDLTIFLFKIMLIMKKWLIILKRHGHDFVHFFSDFIVNTALLRDFLKGNQHLSMII